MSQNHPAAQGPSGSEASSRREGSSRSEASPGSEVSSGSEASSTRVAYVCVPDGVLLQHISDETVLLHLGSGTYFGLDPIGTRMLDLALELEDADAVVTALESEYEAERDTLAHDLEYLLNDLADKGLILRPDAG